MANFNFNFSRFLEFRNYSKGNTTIPQKLSFYEPFLLLNSVNFASLFSLSVSCTLKQLITSAGLTIVPVVPWEDLPRRQGAPNQQLPNFYHAVLMFKRTLRNHKFRGVNVTTTKKGRQLFGGRKCVPPEKILATRAYEKRAPAYVGMGPRMVNLALLITFVW